MPMMMRSIRRPLLGMALLGLLSVDANAVAPVTAGATPTATSTTLRAMQAEIARSIERLRLEGLQKPCFVSFALRDATTFEVVAELGGVMMRQHERERPDATRLQVGSYQHNDENFFAPSFGFGGGPAGAAMPLEDDEAGIRRALWLATDRLYKAAAEVYEKKQAALSGQTQNAEDKNLADFSAAPKVVQQIAAPRWSLDEEAWTALATELSARFRQHPDVFASQVRAFFYRAEVVFANSEGTQVVQPLTLAVVQIDAAARTADGDLVRNHAYHYAAAPDGLPKPAQLTAAVDRVVTELRALRDAPAFDQTYLGPVLFEEQAAAEFFAQRFFSGFDGLLGARRPLVDNPMLASALEQRMGKPLTDLLGKRLLNEQWSIKALPRTRVYQGRPLIGGSDVDGEGVVPPAEIVLVDRGTLKTLLANRTPVKGVASSNGHQRLLIGSADEAGEGLAPSVVAVTTSKGRSLADLRRALLAAAREQGLDYSLIVRRLTPEISSPHFAQLDAEGMLARARRDIQRPGALSDPVLVYRVAVADGREQLLRATSISGLGAGALRKISAGTQQTQVYDTLVRPVQLGFSFGGGGASGVAASFIVPQAVLVDELEVVSTKSSGAPRPPAVPSPLAKR